jgi:hypothetical protein
MRRRMIRTPVAPVKQEAPGDWKTAADVAGANRRVQAA